MHLVYGNVNFLSFIYYVRYTFCRKQPFSLKSLKFGNSLTSLEKEKKLLHVFSSLIEGEQKGIGINGNSRIAHYTH